MNALFVKTLLAASAAVAFGMTALPTAAQAGEIHNRFADQQHRIAQGVGDGQMTRREFASSEWRLHQIAAQRRRDLRANGGRLTAFEYRHLNRELNRNSGNIYFDKHDLSRQPGAPRV